MAVTRGWSLSRRGACLQLAVCDESCAGHWLSFFFNFIDFCLCSAFLAALGAFSSRGAGLITAVVSLVAEHGL